MSTAASDLPGAPVTKVQAPLRFVTAASLFDGHDAAINIMHDIVRAAIQEDADGIAVSSYQGGHNEFFRYMVDRLKEHGASHIKVFGGGGGTITPEEIEGLMEYGVERIYHPHDGMELGLEAMISDLVERTATDRRASASPGDVSPDKTTDVAAMISALDHGHGRCRQEQRHR
jgi:methylmalonyl-CoA mutase